MNYDTIPASQIRKGDVIQQNTDGFKSAAEDYAHNSVLWDDGSDTIYGDDTMVLRRTVAR